MKFTIENRWSGEAQFGCELGVEFESKSIGVQLGAAVKLAYKSSANLSGAYLSGAYLSGANLRGADLSSAYLSGADLSSANLSGANLRGANLRGADLSSANLGDANLRGANLSGAYLSGAYLSSANLRGANLRDANLRGADLSDANLRDANLSGADLSSANLSDFIVPSLHRKIIAAIEAGGTLDMRTWHRCYTTHCRAGWAIHLAGPVGKTLEWCLGPVAAGALISIASCPALDGKVPDFYNQDNEAVLADIRRLAETEPELTT